MAVCTSLHGFPTTLVCCLHGSFLRHRYEGLNFGCKVTAPQNHASTDPQRSDRCTASSEPPQRRPRVPCDQHWGWRGWSMLALMGCEQRAPAFARRSRAPHSKVTVVCEPSGPWWRWGISVLHNSLPHRLLRAAQTQLLGSGTRGYTGNCVISIHRQNRNKNSRTASRVWSDKTTALVI